MIKQETYRLCECGKRIYPPRNSTIWAKKCNVCLLNEARLKSKSTHFFPANYKKKQSTPKSLARERCDKLFSRIIRLKYSTIINGTVICQCYTCKSIKRLKNIDCGHYHNRGLISVRYDRDNARPQCKKCNRFQSGRHTIFAEYLCKEIGYDRFENLRQRALLIGEDTLAFYIKKEQELKNIYKVLLNNLGIDDPFKT